MGDVRASDAAVVVPSMEPAARSSSESVPWVASDSAVALGTEDSAGSSACPDVMLVAVDEAAGEYMAQ